MGLFEDVIHGEEELWEEVPAVERLRAGSRGLEEQVSDRRLKPLENLSKTDFISWKHSAFSGSFQKSSWSSRSHMLRTM